MRRRQFTIATMMIVVAICAVYLAVLRLFSVAVLAFSAAAAIGAAGCAFLWSGEHVFRGGGRVAKLVWFAALAALVAAAVIWL